MINFYLYKFYFNCACVRTRAHKREINSDRRFIFLKIFYF